MSATKTRRTHPGSLAWPLLALVVGFACAGKPAPVDHYYRLAPPNLEYRFETPPLAGTLRVKRPHAEALTDGTHLLYRSRSNPAEVYRDPYQYWSDAPTLLIQDLLLYAFDQARLAKRVIPAGLRSSVDFTLATRLLQLERLIESGSERATVEIEFSLLRETDRSLIFHRRYSDADTIAGTGAGPAVEAYDRVLSRVLTRFLQDLETELDGNAAGTTAWRR